MFARAPSRSESGRRRSKRSRRRGWRLPGRGSAIPCFAGARAASRMSSFLAGPVRVVNIGLTAFARDLAANGAAVAQVDWQPPRAGMVPVLQALASRNSAIQKANDEA